MGVHEGATGFVFGAPGFVFGRPVGSASEQLNDAKAPHEKQVWHELPPPTGKPPFRLELAAVLGEQAVAAIAEARAGWSSTRLGIRVGSITPIRS